MNELVVIGDNSLELNVDAVERVGFSRGDATNKREIKTLAAAEVEFRGGKYVDRATGDDARHDFAHAV